MVRTTCDIAIVGGGVAGSALAKATAERGYRVLVIERETGFRDRVRGEYVFPWGVAEAQRIGIYDDLIRAGAHHPKYWAEYAGEQASASRDFTEDTPQKLPGLCIYHPRMQEALIQAAATAGAGVRRGARVSRVEPGREPLVVLEEHGRQTTVSARLVVSADGRSSAVREWGDFQSRATILPGTPSRACCWRMSRLRTRAASA